MKRLHSSCDAWQNHCSSSLDVSISNECGLLRTRRSQLGGFVDKKKKGPARDHERDIVQYGAYSAFVDKWISMLIKSDTDMSENCGECGITPTARPDTRTTVVSSVCGPSLSSTERLYSGRRELVTPQTCIIRGET